VRCFRFRPKFRVYSPPSRMVRTPTSISRLECEASSSRCRRASTRSLRVRRTSRRRSKHAQYPSARVTRTRLQILREFDRNSNAVSDPVPLCIRDRPQYTKRRRLSRQGIEGIYREVRPGTSTRIVSLSNAAARYSGFVRLMWRSFSMMPPEPDIL
jgi:hypothetical protein